MPVQFTLPPDTRAVGTGNPPADMNAVIDALSAMGAGYNVLNTTFAGGADPTGVTDSTAAFQAAIAAAASTAGADATFTTGTVAPVYVPYGTYLISSGPLVPQPGKAFRLIGAGAKLVTASSGLINFNGAGHLVEADIEICGFTMDVTGGHVFANPNIHGMMHLHHLDITQRSTGSGIFYMDENTNPGTALYKATFSHINYWLGAGTRSVEAWHMVSGLGANLTDITFEHVDGPNPPGSIPAGMDTTQYQFYLDSNDTGAITNIAWRNCLAASFYGGYAKVNGAKNVTIDGLDCYNTYSLAVSNDLITFGASLGGASSKYITVRNVSRNNALGSQGGNPPPYDITFASTCYNVIAENCSGQSPFCINLNGCSKAVLINNGPGTFGQTVTISGQAADTLVIDGSTLSLGTVPFITNNVSGPGPLAQNFDPASTSSSGNAVVSQTQYMCRLDIRRTITITKLQAWIVTAGTGTATAGQNFIGLYDNTGALLKSAGIDAAYTQASGSLLAGTISSTVLTPGTYWVSFVFVGSASPPSLARASAGVTITNANTATSTLRFALNGTAQTSLQSPVTLASNVAAGSFPWWVSVA